ncbi:MAG: phospholipid carrier-dependent glycosyltransferase [Planctomycetaceae bacterium]|nr:phospholipid carrier-dependent glycosyltransferase [Planctomycetaceae bacterium]
MSCYSREMIERASSLGSRHSSLALRLLGLAWLIGFILWFSSFTLPNNKYQNGSPIPRWDLWEALPDLLLENVFPTREPGSSPSGWSYLPQRFDLLMVASWILIGAWGLGHLALRVIGVRKLLDPVERAVFAFGLGLSGLSLLTMICGVAGTLTRWIFLVVIAGSIAGEVWCRLRDRRPIASTAKPRSSHDGPWTISLLACAMFVAIGPFVLAMLLGSMLPPTDFDVKEYHVQGPKEYYLQGRVGFLPHNVYTSFPFLTEMLLLLGMVLRGDWFRGALAGQAVLMTFAPLTALALFAAGRRWFSPTVGWLAALVYLTIPWVYRISIIAYVEGGLSFFLFAALLAALRSWSAADERTTLRFTLLAGLLAGSAVACKYPGVISVAIPLGAAVVGGAFVQGPRSMPQLVRRIGGAAAVFTLGTLITFGPWMLKNIAETGNPVYPLLYTIFGGTDWNDEANAKWRNGHAAPLGLLREPLRIPGDFGRHVVDVVAKSDWQSPLVFGLAPLALMVRSRRRLIVGLWAYVFWLFVTWWSLTHRLDRFWLPLLPVASLLAAAGLGWLLGVAIQQRDSIDDSPQDAGTDANRHRSLGESAVSVVAAATVAAAVLFNLGFVTSALSGYNAYLIDLNAATEQAATPSMRLLNELPLPDGSRVLFVGEAEVFDARFDHVYNTVFDESIFQRWTSAAVPDVPDAEQPLRPMADIRATLAEHGITHVFVNWNEIARYRAPGSYGFTDFVTPERFQTLVEGGVLREVPLDPRWGYQLFLVE